MVERENRRESGVGGSRNARSSWRRGDTAAPIGCALYYTLNIHGVRYYLQPAAGVAISLALMCSDLRAGTTIEQVFGPTHLVCPSVVGPETNEIFSPRFNVSRADEVCRAFLSQLEPPTRSGDIVLCIGYGTVTVISMCLTLFLLDRYGSGLTGWA